MTIRMKTIRKIEKGFTLIETVVAIAVLTIAVVGPMTLAARSLHATVNARNEFIATHLSEEGLEVIRSLRDNNSVDDRSTDREEWMYDIYMDDPSGDPARCRTVCAIDVTQIEPGENIYASEAMIPCPAGNCPNGGMVYFNPNTNTYTQVEAAWGTTPPAPWVTTGFTRKVTLDASEDPDPGDPKREVGVTSLATYSGYGGVPRTISSSDRIFNWFPALHN